MNLFTRRDLWAWLNKPFEIPPVVYEQEQLKLNFFSFGTAEYGKPGFQNA
jgi:hypothetical protein